MQYIGALCDQIPARASICQSTCQLCLRARRLDPAVVVTHDGRGSCIRAAEGETGGGSSLLVCRVAEQ